MAIALAAAAQDIHAYFHRQAASQAAWDAHAADHTLAARFVTAQPDRLDIWVTPLHGDHPVFRFRAQDRYRPFIASDHFPIAPEHLDPKHEGVVYVLQPFETDLEPLFRAFYPQSKLEAHLDPFGRLSFVSVFVPRADVLRRHDPRLSTGGFTAAFYPNDRWQGEPRLIRRDPAVMFHYHSEPMPDPFTADWSAHLTVTTPGNYEFSLMATGPALLLINDTIVIQSSHPHEHRSENAHIALETGQHRLLLRFHEASFLSTVRLWWRPPGQRLFSVIPMDQLRPMPLDQYLALRPRFPRP